MATPIEPQRDDSGWSQRGWSQWLEALEHAKEHGNVGDWWLIAVGMSRQDATKASAAIRATARRQSRLRGVHTKVGAIRPERPEPRLTWGVWVMYPPDRFE